MYEELLQKAGLTKNESLVYLTLLKIGKSQSGKIINEAKISSGKIYETLSKLIDKGLVKLVIENGIKNFIANDPKMLLIYLDDKEKEIIKKREELEKAIPLMNIIKSNEKLENVALIKGFKGISTIVYNSLENAKYIEIMGLTSNKDENFNNFWKKWHNQRVRLKKNAKCLFSDKNTDYWKFFKKLKHTEVREITTLSPSSVMIVDDNTFIFSYQEEFICIHIQSYSISRSFSGFFNSLWNIKN
ncbi:MAG: helix-turn-helix domain-containing protein [Nanoarchaeota archaeon]